LTNDPSNWKSANASAGYATPGFINSNSRPESSVNDNAVNVDPEVFSPSVPGKDFSKINYKFDQSGLIANAKILDLQGRLIKTLANNETLSYEGSSVGTVIVMTEVAPVLAIMSFGLKFLIHLARSMFFASGQLSEK